MPTAVTLEVPDANAWVVGAAAFVVAWGVLWRGIVRPIYRRARTGLQVYQAAAKIIHRELTHNGGTSIKDTTTHAALAVAEAAAAAQRAEQAAQALSAQVSEVAGSQETIFQLFDDVVERNGRDHVEMWDALRGLGVERRRHVRRETDPPAEGASP